MPPSPPYSSHLTGGTPTPASPPPPAPQSDSGATVGGLSLQSFLLLVILIPSALLVVVIAAAYYVLAVRRHRSTRRDPDGVPLDCVWWYRRSPRQLAPVAVVEPSTVAVTEPASWPPEGDSAPIDEPVAGETVVSISTFGAGAPGPGPGSGFDGSRGAAVFTVATGWQAVAGAAQPSVAAITATSFHQPPSPPRGVSGSVPETAAARVRGMSNAAAPAALLHDCPLYNPNEDNGSAGTAGDSGRDGGSPASHVSSPTPGPRTCSLSYFTAPAAAAAAATPGADDSPAATAKGAQGGEVGQHGVVFAWAGPGSPPLTHSATPARASLASCTADGTAAETHATAVSEACEGSVSAVGSGPGLRADSVNLLPSFTSYFYNYLYAPPAAAASAGAVGAAQASPPAPPMGAEATRAANAPLPEQPMGATKGSGAIALATATARAVVSVPAPAAATAKSRAAAMAAPPATGSTKAAGAAGTVPAMAAPPASGSARAAGAAAGAGGAQAIIPVLTYFSCASVLDVKTAAAVPLAVAPGSSVAVAPATSITAEGGGVRGDAALAEGRAHGRGRAEGARGGGAGGHHTQHRAFNA